MKKGMCAVFLLPLAIPVDAVADCLIEAAVVHTRNNNSVFGLVDGAEWHCAPYSRHPDGSPVVHPNYWGSYWENPDGSYKWEKIVRAAYQLAAQSDVANRKPGNACTGNCLKPVVIRVTDYASAWPTWGKAVQRIIDFIEKSSEVRPTDAVVTLKYLRDHPEWEPSNFDAAWENRRAEATKTRILAALSGAADDEALLLAASTDALSAMNAALRDYAVGFGQLKSSYADLLARHKTRREGHGALAAEVRRIRDAALAEGMLSHDVAALDVELVFLFDSERDGAQAISNSARALAAEARRLSETLHEALDQVLARTMDNTTRAAVEARVGSLDDAALRIAELCERIIGYSDRRMQWVSRTVSELRETTAHRVSVLRSIEVAADSTDFLAETERATASAAFMQKANRVIGRYRESLPVSEATQLKYLEPRLLAARDLVEMSRVCDNLLQTPAKGWMETGCIAIGRNKTSAQSFVTSGAKRMIRLSAMLLRRRAVGREEAIGNIEAMNSDDRVYEAVRAHDMLLHSLDSQASMEGE